MRRLDGIVVPFPHAVAIFSRAPTYRLFVEVYLPRRIRIWLITRKRESCYPRQAAYTRLSIHELCFAAAATSEYLTSLQRRGINRGDS